MSGTDFSDNNSGSRSLTTSFLLSSTSSDHQAKESSSNSSNISSYTTTAAGFQMNSNNNNNNSNMVENGGFSWDADSMFHQFHHDQVNGIIKSEELKPTCSWQEAAASGQLHNHNSVDFSSYPLTSLSEDLTGANFDVFHQI
ncbi:hypothetical protein CCACVL1_15006 [Corchorus capsularis]|uniref:Uncharacterized protein n=1 Tax=Corchorus capsularis TaxID=210143 RepID=A0A1R3I4G2_COCAP|nr:hypothetical protein CCACVL1_15006 [Corchorus capsularis]